MAEKLYDYDPADALDDLDSIEFFIMDAIETGDANYIAQALEIISRAKGLDEVASKAGFTREQLIDSLDVQSIRMIFALLKTLNVRHIPLTSSYQAA